LKPLSWQFLSSVSPKKLYLADTGLLANQLGATADRIARDPSVFGPLLENFVVNELRKQASWNSEAPTLFHYLAQSGQEVDIMLEDAQPCYDKS
jgi:uncharacterized protein